VLASGRRGAGTNFGELGRGSETMLILELALRRRNVKSISILLATAVSPCFVVRAACAADAATCPSREAVDVAVRDLLSRSGAAVTAPETKFRVDDEGDHYSVTVLERTRSYTDEARDCDKRAEVAAVFIALTLAPPEIGVPEPKPPPRVEPKSSATETSPSRSRVRARGPFVADLGARAVLAPHGAGNEGSLGGELALSYVRNGWGIKAVGGFETSVGWELANVPLREDRVPFGVLLRRNWLGAALASSLEMGPLVQVLRLRQNETDATERTTFLELGARIDARFQLIGRVAPYAALSLDFSPFGREITVEPRGKLGKTSLLRVGASFGIATNFP
jgi:hypothetical protein